MRAAGMEAPTTELDSLLSEAKAKWDKSRELRRKLEGPGLTEQQKSSRAPFMPKALADETQAHEAWFTLYTRRQEGSSVWVVRSEQIVASDPGDKDMFFDPAQDKVYRHPSFYQLPHAVNHM